MLNFNPLLSFCTEDLYVIIFRLKNTMQNQNQNSNISIEDLLKEHKNDLKKPSPVSAPQKDKPSQVLSDDPSKESISKTPQAPKPVVNQPKPAASSNSPIAPKKEAADNDLPDPSKVAEQVIQKIRPKEDDAVVDSKDQSINKTKDSSVFFDTKIETEKNMNLGRVDAEPKKETKPNEALAENAIENTKFESLKKLDEADIRKKIEQLETELNERNNIGESKSVEAKTESLSSDIPETKKPLELEKKEDEDIRKIDSQVKLPDELNIDLLGKLPKEDQVKVLTNVVYKDGLYKAINTAIKLGDPYLMDLLHDALVDELYAKLKAGKKS